jgi:hippurate hydrolase
MEMNLIDSIVAFQEELKEIRKDIHKHPELSYEEQRTSNLIARKLEQWDIPTVRGIGVTGLIGILKNGDSSRSIGLRADMDALPMRELNEFSHASRYINKMHACGHDGHIAMLLGAAHFLAKCREFEGTIYFIFQPAEEDGGGAQRMIDDGLFERYKIDAVFGMHNWPGMKVGKFGVRSGPMMASSNEFELVVKGKGSHAAQPHKSIDPIITATQIVQSWQTIISRDIDPNDPAILSVTQIYSGSTTNVIPEEATLIGTVRAFSVNTLDVIETRMGEIAEHTAAAFNAEIVFKFDRSYPTLINHPEETKFAIGVLQSMLEENNVDIQVEPTMGAEDFAVMLQHKPGCYVFIGNGEETCRNDSNMGPCSLHSGHYDFNDDLLPIGASYWVKLAQSYLKKPL